MKANNSKRITNAMISADLEAFKAETKANFAKVDHRINEAAKAYKALEARVEVLEHANTKTAPTKKAPAETGKAKNAKAPAKAKLDAVPGCTMTVTEGRGKGAGRMFIHLSFEKHPGTKVLNALKANGFRWYDYKWSAENTSENMAIAKALVG